ncbi:unnamed protein product [Closterium sp. Naga37s-1]|nr:unnamed protein product [Closterium sp. Naga37s-1]
MAVSPRAKRSKLDERPAVARRALDSQPATPEIRYGDLDALPADVWLRIANKVAAEREECCCSWPLVPSAIAMPCIRRALSADVHLVFYEDCQCAPSAVSLDQRFRSFAWLTKQHTSPSEFHLSLTESPPRLVSSLMRSCLFSSLSSIMSLDLYFSRSLPSPPRLLFSLSQAPRLESLLITHGVASDSERDIPRQPVNDPVMVAEMWEIISIMEEQKPNDKGRSFPVLRRLSLDLPACSPLVLRFVSCLSSQLQYLALGAADQFAPQEGSEGAGSGAGTEGPTGSERDIDMDGRNSFSLHLPLATRVILEGINCSISLSAPCLSAHGFLWKSRHARLLLLPTCPAHLTSLSLRTDPPCQQWPLHAPHLTSLDSLCTNMPPEETVCLPPGVLATVKALEWREIRVFRPLDLRAWHGLCCFHAVEWGPVSLWTLRSLVLWPGGLEGLFVDSIGRDVVELFKTYLRGGDGGESLGRRHAGEGSSRSRDETGLESGGSSESAVEGQEQTCDGTDGKTGGEGRGIGDKREGGG